PVAEQCVTVNNQRVCALLDERRKGCIDLLRVARTYDMKLKPELMRCVLRLLRVQLCIWIGWIYEQTHDRGVGYRFAHHLQSDCHRGRGEEAHTGHIAIWSAEASNEPELDRIATGAEDNRDRRSHCLDHHRRNVIARVDHGYWLVDEITGQRHQAIILVFSVLVVNRAVAALDKPYAAKALANPSLPLRGSRTRAAAQIPHHRHRGLLRAGRQRPRDRRAAECGQQFPPSDGDCHAPLPCEVRRERYHATSVQSSRSRRAGCRLFPPRSSASTTPAASSSRPPPSQPRRVWPYGQEPCRPE